MSLNYLVFRYVIGTSHGDTERRSMDSKVKKPTENRPKREEPKNKIHVKVRMRASIKFRVAINRGKRY